MIEIKGNADEGYGYVADVFRRNFEDHGEIGASFCVYRDGRPVVDLWAGFAEKQTEKLWEQDTITTIFSATKGLTAICFLVLADRGLLDYDKKVSEYWPEFAAAGKESITVAQLLNHRAGLHALDQKMSAEDVLEPDKLLAVLESQAPQWKPGSRQAYAAITWGMYAAELFKRVNGGESAGTFFAREIAGPLGAEAWLGLPAELEAKVAHLYPVATSERLAKMVPHLLFRNTREGRVARAMLNRKSATHKAFLNPSPGPEGFDVFNRPEVYGLELLWVNGISNARGLAKIYGVLATGGSYGDQKLVQPQTVKAIEPRLAWERDAVMHKEQGWNRGFIKEMTSLYSPHTESFGHPGMGGSFGFADPVNHLGIGYVMNRMDYHIRSPRSIHLCHALYDCLK